MSLTKCTDSFGLSKQFVWERKLKLTRPPDQKQGLCIVLFCLSTLYSNSLPRALLVGQLGGSICISTFLRIHMHIRARTGYKNILLLRRGGRLFSVFSPDRKLRCVMPLAHCCINAWQGFWHRTSLASFSIQLEIVERSSLECQSLSIEK